MSPSDRALLKKFIEKGLELEKLWARAEKPAAELSELQQLIEQIARAESPDLKRLAVHKKYLQLDMTARHLAAVLVPFERLAGRALRDDEIQIVENDATEIARAPAPLIVIADNIRSAFNVGAIFRTAEAMGLQKVILTGYTQEPTETKTKSTSMGAETFIPWERTERAESAVEKLRAEGFAIICLETAKNAETIGEFRWPEKSVLILGNERFGIEQSLLAKADHVIRIPQYGIKNSLNVGIAFGIAAADYRRSQSQPSVKPIGFFRASAKHPYEARRQGIADQSQETGVIELESGFDQALEDLEGFDRIWIIYRFHHNHHWKPKVLPPRGPAGKKRGVFATRSPYRPNPIGLSSVELVKIEGRKIFVRGFDLLDQTPIYDIKPYLPYADAFPNANAGWTEHLEAEAFSVSLTEQASRELQWLEAKGVSQLRGFLFSNLEFDPLDDERKRVVASDSGTHVLKYRTWRANFTIDETNRAITIEKIFSGYTAADLAASADKYGDKEIHREFNATAD